jgi:hypothetical protein
MMTETDVARLLAYIRTLDNRTIDEATVAAWHDVIGDLRFEDCVQAVRLHFRNSVDYLKPGHVAAYAIAERDHRIGRQKNAEAALKELGERADGTSTSRGPVENRSADVAALVAQVRDVLPKGDRRDLRYQDKTLQRYQPRAAADPNPRFKGFGPVPVPGDNESESPS